MGALDYIEAGHLRGRCGLCCLLSLSFPFGLFCTISKLLQCDSFKLFQGLQLCHDFGACPYAYLYKTTTQKRERLHLLRFCHHVPTSLARYLCEAIPMLSLINSTWDQSGKSFETLEKKRNTCTGLNSCDIYCCAQFLGSTRLALILYECGPCSL